jgi:hypothetical protein
VKLATRECGDKSVLLYFQIAISQPSASAFVIEVLFAVLGYVTAPFRATHPLIRMHTVVHDHVVSSTRTIVGGELLEGKNNKEHLLFN